MGPMDGSIFLIEVPSSKLPLAEWSWQTPSQHSSLDLHSAIHPSTTKIDKITKISQRLSFFFIQQRVQTAVRGWIATSWSILSAPSLEKPFIDRIATAQMDAQ